LDSKMADLGFELEESSKKKLKLTDKEKKRKSDKVTCVTCAYISCMHTIIRN
jgi:hypothetical protein